MAFCFDSGGVGERVAVEAAAVVSVFVRRG